MHLFLGAQRGLRMPQRKFERDYGMLVAFEAGRTLEQLAEDYAVTAERVHAIVTAERHRRTYTPDALWTFHTGMRRKLAG